MVVGKGVRSGKEYTAKDKYNSFKELIQAIAKEEKRVEEIKKDSTASIKDTVEYWIEEYFDESPEDKTKYTKEMKELIKIRVKEAKSQDQTIRLAFENEATMIEEAKEV